MTKTLASYLKDLFMKESEAMPMWTIPEIEAWLNTKKAFENAQMEKEVSGGFQKSIEITSKTYRLQDGSGIQISNDGIEEVNL